MEAPQQQPQHQQTALIPFYTNKITPLYNHPFVVSTTNTAYKVKKDVQEFTQEHPHITTAAKVGAGIVVVYFGVPIVLHHVGFTAAGVAKGSVAAKIHSIVYNSPLFMKAFGVGQSIGALGGISLPQSAVAARNVIPRVRLGISAATTSVIDSAVNIKDVVVNSELATATLDTAKSVATTTIDIAKTAKGVQTTVQVAKQAVCWVGKDDDPTVAAHNIRRITTEAVQNASTSTYNAVSGVSQSAATAVKGAAKATSEGVSQAAIAAYSATNKGLGAAVIATQAATGATVNAAVNAANAAANTMKHSYEWAKSFKDGKSSSQQTD